jgi:quercetin dioxygenase-like cupin family protein
MKLTAIILSTVLATAAVGAQGRVPVKVLQQQDLSVSGREVVTAVAEYAAGSDTGWHTHPGEMVAYMVAGSVLVQQQGRPPVTVRTGEAVIIPAGIAHTCSNAGQTAARMSVTYVVEKGKPLRTDVARP